MCKLKLQLLQYTRAPNRPPLSVPRCTTPALCAGRRSTPTLSPLCVLSGGPAGSISILTGSATSGLAGSVSVAVGATNSGAGSSLVLAAGGTVLPVGKTGGSVFLVSGSSAAASSGASLPLWLRACFTDPCHSLMDVDYNVDSKGGGGHIWGSGASLPMCLLACSLTRVTRRHC